MKPMLLVITLTLTGCKGFYTNDYYKDGVTLRVEGTDCRVVLQQHEVRSGPGASNLPAAPFHTHETGSM